MVFEAVEEGFEPPGFETGVFNQALPIGPNLLHGKRSTYPVILCLAMLLSNTDTSRTGEAVSMDTQEVHAA